MMSSESDCDDDQQASSTTTTATAPTAPMPTQVQIAPGVSTTTTPTPPSSQPPATTATAPTTVPVPAGTIGSTVTVKSNVEGQADVTWKRVVDVPPEKRLRQASHRINAKIKWPHETVGTTEIDFFKVMFPEQAVERWIQATNTTLTSGAHKPLTRDEYYIWLAIWLHLAVRRTHDYRRDYWSEEAADDDPLFQQLYPPERIRDKFGMTRQRFERILQHLRHDADADPEKPVAQVKALIADFNERRTNVYVADNEVVADESMSANNSMKDRYETTGAPRTSIARKPKGVGYELKNACDKVGIMLALELVLGKTDSSAKPYDLLGKNPGVMMRLAEFIGKDTRRHFVGDSAFASVMTAVAMRKYLNCDFTGIIKTAHALVPKTALENLELYPQRGDSVVMEATVEGVDLYIFGWRDGKGGKAVKLLLTTCGEAKPGPPHIKTRYRKNSVTERSETYTLEVPRPEAYCLYFDVAQKVDVHNHYRQGLIGVEEVWGTTTWWHRIEATVLGMITTDAYLAIRHFGNYDEDKTIADFVKQLVVQLISKHKTGMVEALSGTPPPRQTRSVMSGSPSTSVSPSTAVCLPTMHIIQSLKLHPKYQNAKRPKLNCVRCYWKLKLSSSTCAHYCVTCSDDNYIVPVHGPGCAQGYECMVWHNFNPDFEARKTRKRKDMD